MRSKPLSKEEFEEIYSRVPRLTVEVVLVVDGGVVLVLREEKSWHGLWHIPGGTVLYGERLEEAVKRVAREEIGVEVEIKKLIGYIHYPSEKETRGFGWSIGVAFECETKQSIPKVNEDGEEVRVFEKLPEKMVGEQIEFLRDNGLVVV